MNAETHQYLEMNFILNDMEGKLKGEVLKATKIPDGRCAFQYNDRSFSVLCYFKDGLLQKGPWLSIDKKKNTVLIRSQTQTLKGNSYCMTAEIEVGQSGSSSLFRDDKLVLKVEYIQKWLLDWIIPELPELIAREELPIKLSLTTKSQGGTKLSFGEAKNNLLFGRGILTSRNSIIDIGYYENSHFAIGNFIDLRSDGSFQVGEAYADANGELRRRYTVYQTDGTSGMRFYNVTIAQNLLGIAVWRTENTDNDANG